MRSAKGVVINNGEGGWVNFYHYKKKGFHFLKGVGVGVGGGGLQEVVSCLEGGWGWGRQHFVGTPPPPPRN